MSMTQEMAAEHYELAHNELMAIAENYQTPDDASAIALTAAQGLTIDYIDYSIEIIKDFNTHYQCFVGSLEKTLNRLEKTTLDKALLDPLTHCFETVKIPENDKITDSVNKKGWSYKLDLLFAWLRIRMGLDGHK